MDGIFFDAYRPAVWQALQAEYPTRVDPKALKCDQLREAENPVLYIQRQLKKMNIRDRG